METITIQLKPYMASYLYVRYGQSVEPFGYDSPLPPPIRLPHEKQRNDTLYRMLYREIAPRPEWFRKESGNVTFVIPRPHGGKSPNVYNFLSHKGVMELQKAIRAQIKMELFDYLIEQRYAKGHTYKYALRTFLKTYGMEDLVSEESMLRLFYDWRRKLKIVREQEQGVAMSD